MLSTTQLIIYGFLVFVLFPLVLNSLWSGSKPPAGAIGKFYAAERYLNLTGDLMLLTLCLVATTSLAQHFGYIDADFGARILSWIDIPFVILLLAYLALWIRAILKVRRTRTSA